MKLRIPSSLSFALAISAIACHYSLHVEAGSRSSAGGRGGAPSPRRPRGPSSTVSSSKRSSRKSASIAAAAADAAGSSSRSRRSRSVSNSDVVDSNVLGETGDRRDKGPRQQKQQLREDLDFGKFPGDESEIDYDVEDSRAYDEFDQNLLASEGEREEEDEEYLGQDDFYDDDDEFDDYRDDGRLESGRQPRGGRPVGASRVGPSSGSSARRGASTGGGRSNVSSSRSARGTATSRNGRSGGGRRPNGVPADRRRGGRVVVPYGSGASARRGAPQPGAFVRGLSALRESIPDPSAIKDTALQSLSAARETTSKLSSNLYREIKGLTSSELEQVMLKATQPNDLPVKGKHVERLVGVTYQISGRYDIYDAVLRKLWSKMVEKDWRTTIKALYILHRFSADGAPDHQAALKARLRELRRTRDPKRKEKYFNSKQLLAGDSTVSALIGIMLCCV